VAPELLRDLSEPYGAAWRQVVDLHGQREAARHFAKVLGYIESDGVAAVAERLRRTLESGDLATVTPVKTPPPVACDGVPLYLRSVEVPSAPRRTTTRCSARAADELAGRP
jgi:hypothetical protein